MHVESKAGEISGDDHHQQLLLRKICAHHWTHENTFFCQHIFQHDDNKISIGLEVLALPWTRQWLYHWNWRWSAATTNELAEFELGRQLSVQSPHMPDISAGRQGEPLASWLHRKMRLFFFFLHFLPFFPSFFLMQVVSAEVIWPWSGVLCKADLAVNTDLDVRRRRGGIPAPFPPQGSLVLVALHFLCSSPLTVCLSLSVFAFIALIHCC